jgi:hypothetical protein
MPSISDFVTTHADQERPGAGSFEVENHATLRVNLQGTAYAKAGAMVAYRGDVSSRARARWKSAWASSSRRRSLARA